MTTLEKILQEIDFHAIEFEAFGVCDDYVSVGWVKDIIKKYLSCENHTETTRRQQDNGWIPCNPKNIPDKEVLCCDKYGEELIGYLSGTEEDGYECESDGCIMFGVIAWMEKPEPYKPPVESEEEKSMREREEFFKDGE